MRRRFPGSNRTAPRQALLHLPHLHETFLGNRQWLNQNCNVTHILRYDVHVLFFVYYILGHEAVPLLDPTLLKIAGEAKVLAVRATGDAIVVRAGPSDHRHDEIADFYSCDLWANLNDFAERFMADH